MESKNEATKTTRRAGAALFLAIVASFLFRALNLVSTLIMVKIAVGALGLDGYGILSSIIALTAFFAFGDLGLGLALMSRIAGAHALGDVPAMKAAISTSTAMTALVAAGLTSVGILIYASAVLTGHVSTAAIGPATSIGLIGLAFLSIPFALPIRILFGLQRTVEAQAIATLSRVGIIVAMLAVSEAQLGVGAFALAIIGAPTVVFVIAAVVFFVRQRPDLCPDLASFSGAEARRSLKEGSGLVLLSLIVLAEVGFDPILIILFFSATEAGTIDIVSKLFAYIPALVSIGLTPIWPALTAAHARRDYRRVKRIMRACTLTILTTTPVVAFAAGLEFDRITQIWLGRYFTVDPIVIWSSAVSAVLICVYGAQSIAMNARGVIKSQMALGLGFLLVILLAKVLSASLGYLPGIPLVLAILYPFKLLCFHLFVTRPALANTPQ